MTHTPESIAACNAAFIEAIRRSCLSEEDFDREYLCQPAKLSQLISADHYDACILPAPFDAVPDQLDSRINWGELFVGVDCGRSKNLTVAWVLQRGYDNDNRACYRTVCVHTIRDADFPTQYGRILPIVTNRYVAKGLIDQGTQGRALADAVGDITGKAIQPFGMSAPRMAEMAETLRAFVQMRRISMPSDPGTRSGILCVRRKVLPNKRTLSYGGETVDGSHGDEFWAAALALYAAEGGIRSRMLLPEPSEVEVVEAA